MNETILLPSPNWFQVSGLSVSSDGWLVYGGPSKSLCLLEPLPVEYNRIVQGSQGYQAHVTKRAHHEKIVSVAVSPEWPTKRNILTGSADGEVKQWSVEKQNNSYNISTTHSHQVHKNDREEVASVGYSTDIYAITVSCYGNIVKWNVQSNVVKGYSHLLKNFKPTCMSCSPHIALNVAVGTKQGVIFVLDLNDQGNILYKVRGQDEDVVNISWCPQYEVTVNKALEISEVKESANSRMEKIRQQGAKEEAMHAKINILEQSGSSKDLPEDSFEDSVVEPEDDMFDIYTEPEIEEFGHKKYEPENIYVKVEKESEKEVDYLVECLKLKQEIIDKKNQPEESIESLVNALEKTSVNNDGESSKQTESANKAEVTSENKSVHVHKHLLATIGKFGGVRIWSKSGKLVASCAVPTSYNRYQRNKGPTAVTLLWYKRDVLIIVDGKSQVLECNPLAVDAKNKLEWRVLHTLHKRGLYSVITDAPRVQTQDKTYDNYSIWTSAQDRNLIRYSVEKKQVLSVHNTCGGYVYCVQPCPYDARRLAVSIGDGAVRVWESDTLADDDSKLSPGHVTTYWQNVQGKVLTVAWHPTKENLLAFATAEARVGLLDTQGQSERPARVLPNARGAVYSLCWGEGPQLYAVGAGQILKYNTSRIDERPEEIKVSVESKQWQMTVARWSTRGLLCGSTEGGVVLIRNDASIVPAYVFSKMIHTVEWHPTQTSQSSEPSPLSDLIAVCSLDKSFGIVILQYQEKDDGTASLSNWKTLTGHNGIVYQVVWSPHREGQLLSTSHDRDATVRVWDVASGTCTSIFSGSESGSVGAAWAPLPQLHAVFSGDADCCLRLWRVDDFPADAYVAENKTAKKKKIKEKKVEKKPQEVETEEDLENVAATSTGTAKPSKKFLLPILNKQIVSCDVKCAREMLRRHLGEESKSSTSLNGNTEVDIDFVKLFGSINEVNEVLDMELERHLSLGHCEAWIALSLFRGHVDATIRFAAERDLLCPYLLSITPGVSFKYWKDATQLYLAQMDRLIAKGEHEKLSENKSYGGSIYRKVCTLLSVHDVIAAVNVLTEARLYKEAYFLCRTRYLDSIAAETLDKWAKNSVTNGTMVLAAVCFIALGNLSQAATVLGKCNDQDCLSLAADLAKLAGQNTFAEHIEDKKTQIKPKAALDVDEILEQLPSRIELLMKNGGSNGGADLGSGDH